VVYKAEDMRLDRFVALKFLPEDVAQDRQSLERFRREAKAASALNHPNICTIYQIGRVDDGFYLVMELIEGQPLSEMARSTKLTTEAVARYAVQIADALAHAHERQIVHRDLKGPNVVITHDGRVKVLDFGLARRLDKATVDAITRTLRPVESDQSIVGTLPYMAPEVLTGEVGSYQSDIWALGVLLYEAVTGELPFSGSTPFSMSAAILHELPRRPLGVEPSEGIRLSLAGAQPKLPVVIEEGRMALPTNAATPTTHILKPEPAGFPGLVDNEYRPGRKPSAGACVASNGSSPI
jgi:serine/threonine protein kinase